MSDANDMNLVPMPDPLEGVLFLEGFLFMKDALIKQNDLLVQQAFSELYRYVSKN